MTEAVPTLRGLVVGDAPDAWRRAGFTVTGDTLTVGGVTIHLAGSDGARGIRGWWLEGAVAADADGLAHLSTPPTPTADAEHANQVTGVDHVVAGTPDLERTTVALATLGVHPRHTATGIRGRGATYRFFLLGTALLELIAPAQADADADERPAAFSGLAFVGDPDRVGAFGSPARDAIQPGRRIATLHTRDHGISVPLAVMSPRR